MLRRWPRDCTSALPSEITLDGVLISVVRKRIKHFYLRVDRHHGRVRLSAPRSASDDEVRLVVTRRLDWIKRQQAKLAAAPPVAPLRFLSGETHYFLGEPLQLVVIEGNGRGSRVICAATTLELHIRRRSRLDERRRAIDEMYRRELRTILPPLIEKWGRVMGVSVAQWRIKRMRTRWGTCNIRARRIWLSLELGKYPLDCVEYVVVHELVHLLERRHNARFKTLMDAFLPDWRVRQRTLGHRRAGHYKQGDGRNDQIDPCD
jgi:predicted metal-dependent hydrolase